MRAKQLFHAATLWRLPIVPVSPPCDAGAVDTVEVSALVVPLPVFDVEDVARSLDHAQRGQQENLTPACLAPSLPGKECPERTKQLLDARDNTS